MIKLEKSKRVKFAFTLIELLVVIAIIALLAAILFPVFARARENARKSSCLNNMKQMSVGVIQYIQDFDERYPFARYDLATTDPAYNTPDMPFGGWQRRRIGWQTVVVPYIKNGQIFRCPSMSSTLNPADNTARTPLSYYINREVSGDNGNPGNSKNASDLSFSAATILIGEGRNAGIGAETSWANGWGWTDGHDDMSGLTSAGAANVTDKMSLDRHLGGANYAFADGHVKFYSLESLKYLINQTNDPRNGKSPTYYIN